MEESRNKIKNDDKKQSNKREFTTNIKKEKKNQIILKMKNQL